MGRRSNLAIVSIVLALLSILPCVGHIDSVSASAQGQETKIRSNTFYIIQGENDATPYRDSVNDFFALRIISYDLPYDATRVYTKLPAGAHNITALTTSQGMNQSSYANETSGPMSGMFYVDVPSSFDRTGLTTNVTNNSIAFSASGSVFTGTEYSSGSLHVAPSTTSGEYVSAEIPVDDKVNILSGNISIFGTSLSNVSISLSNDNTTWISCANVTETVFSGNGTSLKVRLSFAGNDSQVSEFRIDVKYVRTSALFNVHLSYAWTLDFIDKHASIDFSEPTPYASSGSFVAMLYLVKGYTAQGAGLDLHFDEEGAMSTHPEKDLYINRTFPVSGVKSFSADLTQPDQKTSWALYLGAVGLAALLFLGFLLIKQRRAVRSAREGLGESPSEDAKASPEAPEDDRDSRKDLVSRKKEILKEMDDVKGKSSSGALSKEETERELARLRREFKQVRNELNRTPKDELLMKTAEPPKSGGSGPLIGPYEAVLASLARLDDDFERGRLPEGTYKSLRKEYVSKAAAIMAAEHGKSSEPDNPLGAEKTKLMEAIVALEDEHARGEVDGRVYDELRSSYRRELAEIMRKIEES